MESAGEPPAHHSPSECQRSVEEREEGFQEGLQGLLFSSSSPSWWGSPQAPDPGTLLAGTPEKQFAFTEGVPGWVGQGLPFGEAR